MALATSLVVLFFAELLQIFQQNFYSNTSRFSLLWSYLRNSQVSVYRTIGPTLVFLLRNHFLRVICKYRRNADFVNGPRHEKIGFLHIRKQGRRLASR